MKRIALLLACCTMAVAAGCSGSSGEPVGEAPAAGLSGAASGDGNGGPGDSTDDPGAAPVAAEDDLSGTPAPPPEDPAAPPPANGGTLRIMSYNIKVGLESSLASIATAITTEQPDIVGLQEVDELTNRSGKVRQTEELSTLTNLGNRHFGANFAFDGGHYGLAVLSRFPIANPRVIRMDTHTQRGNGYEPRIALAVDVTAYGKAITFVTMHASLHEEERAGNAQRVLAALGPQRLPTVITGDMNEKRDNAIGKAFTVAGFVDAHYEKTTNPLAGWTAPASFPTRRIDFVYKDKPFGPTKFSWVPGTKASDHRPVMVTFDTPK